VNGDIRKSGSTVLLSSSLNLPIDIIDTGLDFDGLLLVDESSFVGGNLSSVSNGFLETVQGIELAVTYTVTSTKIDELDAFTVNGVSYSDVEVVDIDLELSVDATVDIMGNSTMVPVIDIQDVMKIRTYYALDVGIIKSDTQFSYELNATTAAILANLNIDLGAATTGSQTIIQELNTYEVFD